MQLVDLFKNYINTETKDNNKNLIKLKKYNKSTKASPTYYPTLKQLNIFEEFYKENFNKRIQLTKKVLNKVVYRERMLLLIRKVLNNTIKLVINDKIDKTILIEKLNDKEKTLFIKSHISDDIKDDILKSKRGNIKILNVYRTSCSNHKVSTTCKKKKMV